MTAVTLSGCSAQDRGAKVAATAAASATASAPSAIAFESPPPEAGSGDQVTDKPIIDQAPVLYTVDPKPSGSAKSAPARNEVGQLWTLDEAGARACSFTEFAFRAPEMGTDPAKPLGQLRQVIGTSKNADLVSAVNELPEEPSTAQLAEVLQVCASLGYQL